MPITPTAIPFAAPSNGNGVTSASFDSTGATGFAVCVSRYTGGGAVTVSDSKGNTWAARGERTNAGGTIGVQWYTCVAPSSVGAGHTVTVSGSGSFSCIGGYFFTGTDSASYGSETGASGNTATSQSPGSLTPDANGSLLLSAECYSAGTSPSIDSGYTEQHLNSSGNNNATASAYFVQTTAAAISPTWSWTGSQPCVGSNIYIRPAAGPAQSFTATPNDLPKNHAGNITITLAGTSTTWAGGGSEFSISGVAGVTKVSENVTSATAATLVITTGATAGTLTITDGDAVTQTVTITTATLAISPTSGSTGTTPTLTLTGAHTVWSQETAAGLFSVSGGTGASIGTPTVSNNTSATAVLTVGSAAGTLTVTDTSTGATATFTASVPPSTIPVTNTALYFSPWNWYSDGAGAMGTNNVKGSSTYAQSNTPGAYLFFNVTSGGSGSIKLNLDTTSLQTLTAANCPTIRVELDGVQTTTLLSYSASAVQVTVGTGLASGSHSVKVWFKSVDLSGSSSMGDRWTTPLSLVKITGIEIDGGSSMGTYTAKTKALLVYGDSVTEGADAVGTAEANADVDATVTFARWLAAALGAEYGAIGFSAQGWTQSGYGNVPKLYDGTTDASQAWNKFSAGKSRLVSSLLSPAPDYLVTVHGINDYQNGASDASVTAAVSGWIAAARAAAPSAKIFILIGPSSGGAKRSAITTGVTNAADANCFLIDLGTAFDNTMGSGHANTLDGLHLSGARGHADYASLAAALIQTHLTAGGTSGGFVIGG